MATMPGKTDRYRPNDPSWQSAPFYGGFMPSIVPDQTVAKSPYYPSSVVDKTFAALGPLVPQSTQVASVRPSWTMPAWNQPTRMDIAAIDKRNADAASLDSLLAYTKGIPDATAINPAVVAATNPATPNANVTASMKPRGHGGLLDLIFGPSKNGLSGLPGLVGGPNQGGILQMLFGGDKSTSGLPRRAAPTRVTGDALVARATGATSSAENQAWREKTFGGDGRSLAAR